MDDRKQNLVFNCDCGLWSGVEWSRAYERRTVVHHGCGCTV